jgi:PIN domain nuclease of toxin-antitoxin system
LTILDAYALVALLANEPAADEVAELLAAGDCAITHVNLCESVDVLDRTYGIAVEESRLVIAPLLSERIREIATSDATVWRAGELRVRHYDRRAAPLSLADCVLLAVATDGDRIATADVPVANVARSEGIGVVALPDSAGARP